MDEQPAAQKGNSSMKIGVAVLALIVFAVIGYTLMQSRTASDQAAQISPTATQQSEPTQAEQPTQAQQASEYKDGTYTAVGNYTSPGGQEQLGVTLTLADGVITGSEVEVKATRPISKTRQTDFAANYKSFVEGKNIDEVSLTKVSGSSLSPKGFNDAVEQIKEQAS